MAAHAGLGALGELCDDLGGGSFVQVSLCEGSGSAVSDSGFSYAPHTVRRVGERFDRIWAEAAEYDLASLFEPCFEPHPPYLVYLRMLWERYGEELSEEAEADLSGVKRIRLTPFRTEGLLRAKRILAERDGVLITDEVGLGKTFLAGELIREASLDRCQRVLVITPATLRDGPWRAFIPRSRAAALRRLLAGSPPKKVVLLTATPVNCSLWDLYHQLGYFLRNDAVFADTGIPSMHGHFARAMEINPNDLTPEHLFDVLDAVAVRRTRSFVKRFYPHDTVPIRGQEQAIAFPTQRVRKVTYDLDAVPPGFFDRIARALDPDAAADDPDALTLAR